jgi:membrane-associated phospholipid phosphatase
VAALAAFGLVALVEEPTALDRELYALARRLYRPRIVRAQRPLEAFGLPGAHIPASILGARLLRRLGHRGGETIAASAVASWLAVRVLRSLVHRPRPPRPPGRGPKSESTFPSGHTTELTALAIVTAHVLEYEQILTRRQATVLRLGLPLLIGVDRVYVREHWFTDVLGGWTLGAAVGLALSSIALVPARVRCR